ncbi:hypothetical protein GEMRC1_004620 [Eukaryota sp. GEM-RC1]
MTFWSRKLEITPMTSFHKLSCWTVEACDFLGLSSTCKRLTVDWLSTIYHNKSYFPHLNIIACAPATIVLTSAAVGESLNVDLAFVCSLIGNEVTVEQIRSTLNILYWIYHYYRHPSLVQVEAISTLFFERGKCSHNQSLLIRKMTSSLIVRLLNGLDDINLSLPSLHLTFFVMRKVCKQFAELGALDVLYEVVDCTQVSELECAIVPNYSP